MANLCAVNKAPDEKALIKNEEVEKIIEILRRKLIIAAYYKNDIFDENLINDIEFVKVDTDKDELVFKANISYNSKFDQKLFSLRLSMSEGDNEKMGKFWSDMIPGYENEKEVTFNVKTKVKTIKDNKKNKTITIKYNKGERAYDKIKTEITIHKFKKIKVKY